MKNYIEVFDLDNKLKKMEIVTTFSLDGYKDNYIIYSELDKSHYYVAKYRDNKNLLNTDLSNKELALCNKVLKEVVKLCN